MRTLLFVPGNRPDMLEKATGISSDAFAPDMEDAVPPGEKSNARGIIADALPALAGAGRLVIPRVNSLRTGLLDEDVRAVVGPHVTGISVGKIERPDDILEIDAALSRAERAAGVESGTTGLLPWLETANAIVNAFGIASASRRVRWIAFGGDDFTADMGISRPAAGGLTEPGQAAAAEPGLLYPRSAVAVAARAARVQALDTPYVAYQDAEGLRAEAQLARMMGFTGKCAIHPAQLEHIAAVFAPDEAEIAYARRVMEAWEEATARGSGATSLDGRLIDTPVVERARRLLDSVDQGRTR